MAGGLERVYGTEEDKVINNILRCRLIVRSISKLVLVVMRINVKESIAYLPSHKQYYLK